MKTNLPLHLFVFALTAMLAGAGYGLANNEGEGQFTGAVGNLGVDIAEVATGGYWVDGSNSGTSRLVVTSYGKEHIYNALYAQWLAADKESGRVSVIATIEVAQLSHQPLFIIGSVSYVRDRKGEGAAFNVILIHRYSQEQKNVRINLESPSTYSVENFE